MLRSLAVSLAFLWAVNAVESDAFGALVVQNFDSVAIEHRDDGAAESPANAELARRTCSTMTR